MGLERGINAIHGSAARLALSTGLALMAIVPALAQQNDPGQPQPWQMNLPDAASPMAADISSFHWMLIYIITIISLFVAGLLGWVAYRFNSRANPKPARFTHNSLIEVVWTVVPVLILVVIAIPSFKLLREQELLPTMADKARWLLQGGSVSAAERAGLSELADKKDGERIADLTVKVTGYQWYWGFEYPGEKAGFKFEAVMLQDDERNKRIAAGTVKSQDVPRNLAVDNEMVVPVNKVVRVQVTANDVIHSFSNQALGFRKDAVPGRLNETWFMATREGVYYGMCSRLCGANHAYMPYAIRVVSDAKYAAWLGEAKKKYAAIETATQVAVTTAIAH